MKKMRFLAFMLSVAFLATTFTSCSDDDEGFINISLDGDNPTEVFVGQEFTIGYSVTAEKNIEEIKVLTNNQPVPGSAVTKIKNVVYVGDFSYTAEEAGEIIFSIQVTDKDGTKEDRNVTVTAKEETTALGDWEEAALGHPVGADNPKESAAINLTYNQNKDDNTAEFKTLSGDLVIVDNADFETVESLEAAYDAGDKANSFEANSDANFKDVYYITIVEDEYVLVHMTDLKFGEGNNNAFFKYKK